jgi:patatin-like phospholipase/acyl hydrolase
MSKTNASFKILSIDGGGFRGVYAAHLLQRIETEFSVDWRKDFGLIAGTSTGAIIAACLALGFPTKKVMELYKQHGTDIFHKSVVPRLGIFGSKYDNTGLRGVLHTLFGSAKLGDISVPLILPATDIANGCVHIFKSSYNNEFFRDKDVLVSEAVLASCSAPTYFSPIMLTGNKYLLADGGLWANSPALVAVLDAKKRLNTAFQDLRVLSIGTGKTNQFYPIKKYRQTRPWGWGFATRWGRGKFIEMLLNLQSENANNMLGLLLDKGQILRLNFESDQKHPLDSPEEFDDLVTKADHEFSHKSAIIKQFITQKA